MIRRHFWHLNVNKSFDSKIGSEQALNRPIILCRGSFHENHTFIFLTYELHTWKNLACFWPNMKVFTTIEILTRRITYLQKNNMEKLSWMFSIQIVTLQIWFRADFCLDILAKPNAFITHFSVTLTLTGIRYIHISYPYNGGL